MRKLAFLLSFLLLCQSAFAGVDFDEVDDLLSCGSDTSLDNLGSLSYYVRFIADDGGEGDLGSLIHKSVSGTTIKSFRIENRGGASGTATLTMTATYTGVILSVTPGDNSITFGAEHSAIFAWGGLGATPHIYVDGVEVASYRLQQAGTTAESTDASGTFTIGARVDGAQVFNGIIREVAVWTSEVTAGEANHLHNARTRHLPLQIQPSNLRAYWTLDDEEEGTSADGDTFSDKLAGTNTCTGDDGANNTGLTAKAESVLSYP
jgi:hypothetical protein